ncbi:mannose-6-phosphate isomerase, class I [Ectobacillus funiculus]|uniref:mannose-6-phosphate isomerase, class I n=1 Tax=Ectobacillus funiculus TaxID=137993 RepID=UPI00397A54D0
MNMQPLFLQPVFQDRIWGGTALQDLFGYNIPSDKTGECWAISAHPNGQSIVNKGEWEGKTLSELWENHRELFGHFKSEKFPLLTKILDANDDLSVQVHPNDGYANKHENGEYGKTECWYIIDCKEDAELVFGHNAKSKEEASEMISNGEWSSFLRRIKIKPGDFFYVPSGTIHALCEGTLVLETQQNSDTTYRLYDYERMDEHGDKRELHLKKSLDVTIAPHQEFEKHFSVETQGGSQITKFIQSDYFTVYKWDVTGELNLKQDTCFMLASVIDGEGTIEKDHFSYSLKKGDHFILPYKFNDFSVKGDIQLIASHP